MLIMPFGRKNLCKSSEGREKLWLQMNKGGLLQEQWWRWDAILTLPAGLLITECWCAETSHMPHIGEMETLAFLYINRDPKCVWWSVHSKKHEEYLHTCWHALVKSAKYLALSYSLEDIPKKLLVLLIKLSLSLKLNTDYMIQVFELLWFQKSKLCMTSLKHFSCWCLICPDFVSSGLLAIVHKHRKNLSFRFEILL